MRWMNGLVENKKKIPLNNIMTSSIHEALAVLPH